MAADGAARGVRRLQSAGRTELKLNLMVPADCQPMSASQQGADAMSDHDQWMSYSHWGMFPTHEEGSN
jgi:hypothetical protein